MKKAITNFIVWVWRFKPGATQYWFANEIFGQSTNMFKVECTPDMFV